MVTKLQDHIRVVDDDPLLSGRQIAVEADSPIQLGIRRAQGEFGVDAFVAQHHAPGKAVALLGPTRVARVEQVAQGDQ